MTAPLSVNATASNSRPTDCDYPIVSKCCLFPFAAHQRHDKECPANKMHTVVVKIIVDKDGDAHAISRLYKASQTGE